MYEWILRVKDVDEVPVVTNYLTLPLLVWETSRRAWFLFRLGRRKCQGVWVDMVGGWGALKCWLMRACTDCDATAYGRRHA